MRETVETNDINLQLPSFTLMDLSAGYHNEYRNMSLALYLGVNNVFNKTYEVIRSYALPGRTVQLTLTVGLNKKIS